MNIGYIISTNVDYEFIALPRLIASLYNAGVHSEEIAVFVGRDKDVADATVESIHHSDGYRVYRFSWGAFEYTALIGAVMVDLPFERVFLLHDTCETGPAFKTLVRQGAEYDVDIVSTNNALCNFGLYRVDFLKRAWMYLGQLINCDKHTAIEHEGIMYRKRMGTTAEFLCGARSCEVVGHYDVYGLGVPRIIEYYPAIDLYKYKANYGNTHRHNYYLRP